VGPAEMADAMPLGGLRGGSFWKVRESAGEGKEARGRPAARSRTARKNGGELMCAKIRARRFENRDPPSRIGHTAMWVPTKHGTHTSGSSGRNTSR
jgi:hypothetical protein